MDPTMMVAVVDGEPPSPRNTLAPLQFNPASHVRKMEASVPTLLLFFLSDNMVLNATYQTT